MDFLCVCAPIIIRCIELENLLLKVSMTYIINAVLFDFRCESSMKRLIIPNELYENSDRVMTQD